MVARADQGGPGLVHERPVDGASVHAQVARRQAVVDTQVAGPATRLVAEVAGCDASIYPKLAAAFAAQGQSADYESFLRGLVAERPADSDLAIALARALAQRGDVEAAISEIRRLLAANPRNLGARVVLGQLLLSDTPESRRAEANKEYGQLLEVLAERHDLTPPERLE